MKPQKQLWSTEELVQFFNSCSIPDAPVRLDACTTIINMPLFISSHIATINKHNGNNCYLSYFKRLEQLKELIIKTSK
jgi:hypothetical protein